MSRLGEARPNSRKLRCRCDMSARCARSSCDQPRRRRHQRSVAAKSCGRGMSTSQVVAESVCGGKMPRSFSARQEGGLGLGVLIAIVSSALGGTAAAVTRYLVGDADALTLAILRWGIGFVCVLPVALLLRVRWPARHDWPAVAALGVSFFGLFFILYN